MNQELIALFHRPSAYTHPVCINGRAGFGLFNEKGELLAASETMTGLWTVIATHDLIRPETLH